jgi:hypothetical protein
MIETRKGNLMSTEAKASPLVAGLIEPHSYDYLGFTVCENAAPPGAPALVTIYDGVNDAGPLLEVISLNATQSSGDNYLRPGRLISTRSLFVTITGSVKGSVFS